MNFHMKTGCDKDHKRSWNSGSYKGGISILERGIIMAIEDINMMNYITKLLYPTIAKKTTKRHQAA